MAKDPTPKEFALNPDDIPYASSGLDAPTYYVDYIRGTIMASGVAKLSFIDNRMDAIESNLKAVRVVTLITPTAQLRTWANYLNKIADQQGVPKLEEVSEEPGADG